MQGGIHLISGLLISRFLPDKKAKVGVSFGAIFPDIDILAVVFLYLMTGNEELVYELHRTATHSFFILLIFVVIAILYSRRKKEGKFDQFIIAFALGVSVHIILDLFYLGGVVIFWPFFGEVCLSPVLFEEFSILSQKLITITDFLTDPIFYYLPLWYVSNKKKTNKKFRPWLFRIMIIDIIINTGLLIYAFTSVSLKIL